MALPPDIGLICFGHRTRMAARAVTRACNAGLRPLNLQITQFTLLVAIDQDADESVAARADRLDIEPSALLRNLGLLEDRGLILADGGRGRRGRRYTLTSAGRDLLDQAAPIWLGTQARFAEALAGQADETRAALMRLETAALTIERGDP